MTDARLARESVLVLVQDTSVEFEDDFTNADGEPWNTARWNQDAGSGGGDTVIDGNRGKAEASAGNANSGGRGRGKQGRVANQNLSGSFQLCEIDEPCSGGLWLQTSDDWADLDNPTDGYGILLPADSNTIQLVKVISGTVTELATGSWDRTIGQKEFRFRRVNDKLRFRLWDAGEDEPQGWLISTSDTDLPEGGIGGFQLAYTCPTAPSVDACILYDDINVGEDDSEPDTVNGGGGGSVTGDCAFDESFSTAFDVCTETSTDDRRIGGTGAIRKPPRLPPRPVAVRR